jgi:hypothetical protein
VDFFENGKFSTFKANDAAASKVKKWLKNQYERFAKALCEFISSDSEWAHALSIRTLIEVSILYILLAGCLMYQNLLYIVN